MVQTASLPVLAAIALNESVALEPRLAAAEKAVIFGAASPALLAQLYDKINFRPIQIVNAVSFAESDASPRGVAALYRAAAAQTIPVARAEALQKLWTIARARDVHWAVVRVSMPMAREIPLAPELAWFAADAGRAMLLAGELELARRWHDFALGLRAVSREAEAAADALYPLLRLAGGDALLAPDPARLAAWDKSLPKRAEGIPDGRRVTLSALFTALDESDAAMAIDPGGDAFKPRSGPMPDPRLWLRLVAAAGDERVGEATLAALAALGSDGTAAGNVYVQHAAIAALWRIGLEREARALAVEAALAAGL